jgi:hypothetical protein
MPDQRHHRLVSNRLRRDFPSKRDSRIVDDDRARALVEAEAERRERARKLLVIVVRLQQVAEARTRRQRHSRTNRARTTREVDVAPLSEVPEMEAKYHQSYCDAKGGESVGSERSG